MFEIEFDFDEVAKRAAMLGNSADQMPYVMARSLNDAAEVTRSFLIQTTWPSHVKQRNASFIKAALTTKGARATKDNPTVEIYDKLDRGGIELQAEGGTKVPLSGNLAIGGDNVMRGPRGVPVSQRPRKLKNAFRKGDVIYQRIGKNRLKLMYVLKPSAKIPKRVPFHEDFNRIMSAKLVKALPKNIELAMRTRR